MPSTSEVFDVDIKIVGLDALTQLSQRFEAVAQNAQKLGGVKLGENFNQAAQSFANSVTYLVTGASGGYGGPSIRDLTIGYAPKPKPVGQFSFEEAVAFCEPLVFGPLTQLHLEVWAAESEISFDNDPADLVKLSKKRGWG